MCRSGPVRLTEAAGWDPQSTPPRVAVAVTGSALAGRPWRETGLMQVPSTGACCSAVPCVTPLPCRAAPENGPLFFPCEQGLGGRGDMDPGRGRAGGQGPGTAQGAFSNFFQLPDAGRQCCVPKVSQVTASPAATWGADHCCHGSALSHWSRALSILGRSTQGCHPTVG